MKFEPGDIVRIDIFGGHDFCIKEALTDYPPTEYVREETCICCKKYFSGRTMFQWEELKLVEKAKKRETYQDILRRYKIIS